MKQSYRYGNLSHMVILIVALTIILGMSVVGMLIDDVRLGKQPNQKENVNGQEQQGDGSGSMKLDKFEFIPDIAPGRSAVDDDILPSSLEYLDDIPNNTSPSRKGSTKNAPSPLPAPSDKKKRSSK